MWDKYLKSKVGSTLIMVLMTFSILSILGLALLSFSVINIKLKIIDKNQKISLYLAEAGLEEAYAKVEKIITIAIDKGIKNVETELVNFIAIERAKNKETRASRGYIRSDASVNMDKIKTDGLLDKWFRKGYAEKFNEKENSNNLYIIERKLEEDYTTVDSNLDNKKPVINVSIKKTFDTDNLDSDSKFEIILSSKFTHKNISRNIQSMFAISIPPYDAPYSVENVVLKENVLWTKALISDKDIVVKGKNVTINGDIYAYGTNDSDNEKTSHGIIVGQIDNSTNIPGNLTVNGNVTTNAYLTTRAKDSNINISNGEVFCHSLTIAELDNENNENGLDVHNENCNITINGNVNTKDDIKLNGEHSKIEINGNYYGFSEGLEGYDKSSSIIINSDDTKEVSANKSKIIISGSGKPKSYYADSIGNYIAGTVYVNLATNYQSGESISVKGNYKTYTKDIKTLNILNDTSANPFEITLQDLSSSLKRKLGLLDNDGKLKSGITYPIANPFRATNVDFEYNDPIFLANKFKNINNMPNIIPLNASEKADYFFQAYKEDKSDTANANDPLINLGDETIDVRNIKASTGVYLAKDIGSLNNDLQRQTFVSTELRDFYTRINKEFNYYVNVYGDAQENMNLDGNSNTSKASISQGYFQFKSNIKEYSNEELTYVNNSQNNLYIVGPQGADIVSNANNDVFKLNSKKVSGIIVTNGDVHLLGNIDYNGTIITTGNIYFEDDNKKIITNNYKTTTNIENNYILSKVVEDLNNDGTQVGDMFVQNSNWSKEIANIGYVSKLSVDSNVKTYYKLSQLIKVSEWKKLYAD